MHINSMPDLVIDNLILKKPIIQGGMGVGISMSGLASAVAKEGGIGVISSVALGLLGDNPKTGFKGGNQTILKQEIRKARRKNHRSKMRPAQRDFGCRSKPGLPK